jgi:hypothetical protein
MRQLPKTIKFGFRLAVFSGTATFLDNIAKFYDPLPRSQLATGQTNK